MKSRSTGRRRGGPDLPTLFHIKTIGRVAGNAVNPLREAIEGPPANGSKPSGLSFTGVTTPPHRIGASFKFSSVPSGTKGNSPRFNGGMKQDWGWTSPARDERTQAWRASHLGNSVWTLSSLAGLAISPGRFPPPVEAGGYFLPSLTGLIVPSWL